MFYVKLSEVKSVVISFLGRHVFFDSNDIIFPNCSNPDKMRKLFNRAL